MLRFMMAVLFLVSFLVLGIPAMLVEWIIGRFNPAARDKSARALVNWGFRCIRAITGTNLIVRGLDNIPKDTAVLYVGNHRSYFDIVLTSPLFPGITGYVAKSEMKKWPLLNIWMIYIHCLFLDRKDIRQGLKTILAGVEEVKKGVSLCIFPEGTRNKVNDTFLPFHEGSFKIAEKGDVPVIPMTIVNSADVFEDHFPRIRKTTVVIDFGAPVRIKELDKETRRNLAGYVSRLISEKYFALKKEYFG